MPISIRLFTWFGPDSAQNQVNGNLAPNFKGIWTDPSFKENK